MPSVLFWDVFWWDYNFFSSRHTHKKKEKEEISHISPQIQAGHWKSSSFQNEGRTYFIWVADSSLIFSVWMDWGTMYVFVPEIVWIPLQLTHVNMIKCIYSFILSFLSSSFTQKENTFFFLRYFLIPRYPQFVIRENCNFLGGYPFIHTEVHIVKISQVDPMQNILFCAFNYNFLHSAYTLYSHMAQP